jgi:hypothetical protein
LLPCLQIDTTQHIFKTIIIVQVWRYSSLKSLALPYFTYQDPPDVQQEFTLSAKGVNYMEQTIENVFFASQSICHYQPPLLNIQIFANEVNQPRLSSKELKKKHLRQITRKTNQNNDNKDDNNSDNKNIYNNDDDNNNSKL